MWLLIAFIAVPLIEIALFVQVGGLIGLGPTLAIVLATAVAGTWLVRRQGALALAQLRGALSNMRDPTEPIAHGALILLAGALLLTPGFFTDTLGLLLLFPAVRGAVLRYLAARIRFQRFTVGPGRPGDPTDTGTVIDGAFTEVTPKKPPLSGPPDRTRH